MKRYLVAVMAGIFLAFSWGAAAEEPAVPGLSDTPIPKGPLHLLRVDVVMSRFDGERRISEAPYSILVSSDGKKAELKMGVEVPIAVTRLLSRDEGADHGPVTSFQYRNVGANFVCSAQPKGEGVYQLRLMAETSSIPEAPAGDHAPAAMASDKPRFNTFNVTLTPVLRDGQAVELAMSTDPVTGEVLRIRVALTRP